MQATLFALIAFIASVLFISAVQAQGQKHCLDDEFTTRVALFDPTKKYDDLHEVFFSVKNQAQRVDIHEFHPHLRRTSIYLLHNEGKMYFVDRGESKCESRPIEGKLEQYCIASNATHVGQITFGGSLKTDVWEEETHGNHIRIVLTAHSNVPVNVFGRGGHHVGTIFEEFFNFKHGVEDPEKTFELPRACKHADSNAPLSEEAKVYAKRAADLLSVFQKHD
uniref:Uncharacterized protein n=1 Tax=Percolomonas cosmopolitus TaxID=63605 RepID=A0A7S1KKU1_9EUKA|mmetsp:Transcript_10139/g.37732  ORF Transcript_10139/g.37732 Transcript_10139/m.37732 type:complete len:222 (+) Transcript_10139:189-854(+)|eukprot:CAMPEP_0117438060 /NCGR_PEP_ID=MMETSP0759-20121206/1855_1 /TAXON_ID=63605 /ORGANISM="Percolomonas cosmopolitus, Strain WS" /LENGTH=221 /DNA_ID=CAMNT_0005229733 /DNA_START=151 /DNA_END=816 /DNA_ORIENTATION=+